MAVTKRGKSLYALSSAAAALSNIAGCAHAAVVDGTEIGAKAHKYYEVDRMEVKTTMFRLYSEIVDDTAIEASYFNEVISGASPKFVTNESGKNVQVLSSASIKEERDTGSISISHTFDEYGLTITPGISYSDENDYKSDSLSLSVEKESDTRNTSILVTYTQSSDDISIDTGLTFTEKRKTRSLSIGLTQVINPVAIYQTSVSFTSGDGYFNDPYKYTTSVNGNEIIVNVDTRPDNHSQFSWLNRFKWHYRDTGITAGIDYRFYKDSWDVLSHTIRGNVTYRASNNWSFDTSLRYYTQKAASFYYYELPSTVINGPISTDHRLAAYGAISPALKIIYEHEKLINASLSYQLYKQQDSLFLGTGSGNSINELDASILSFDVNIRF